MDEKYFLQVYLEECKYKIKKIQMPRFINAKLKSNSDDDSDDDYDMIMMMIMILINNYK